MIFKDTNCLIENTQANIIEKKVNFIFNVNLVCLITLHARVSPNLKIKHLEISSNNNFPCLQFPETLSFLYIFLYYIKSDIVMY